MGRDAAGECARSGWLAPGLASELAAALLPVAAVASWAIYRWTERVVLAGGRRRGAAGAQGLRHP